MDAMEDMDLLSGSNTHLSKLSSECNMAATAATKGTFPGLKYRHIGKTGLKISNIGLGSIKTFAPNVDPEVSEEIVTLAYDHGINFFDVCDPYMSDKAERELGKIFAKKEWPRRSYFVSTRVFWHRHDMCSLSRKEILESVKQSLDNLGLDYIDMIVIHKYDPNCPLEEVLRAMTYLVDNGKIMYWSTARWSPFELFEAYSKAKEFRFIGPTCELAEYHWFHREKVELYMAELYNKMGLGLLSWSPVSFGLAQGEKQEDSHGLLTKLLNKSLKYQVCNPKNAIETTVNMTDQIGGTNVSTSQTMGLPGQAPSTAMLNDLGTNKIKDLNAIAERLGCNLVQLQVAWQLRNNTVQCTTISASTPEQVMELLNSLAIVPKLTHGYVEDIEKILNNKPSRPPMISTLQQRWSTTGGVPPC